MTEEAEREGRIVKLEVTLAHVVTNQERLEDKIDKNHDEVMKALKERKCPGQQCEEHAAEIQKLKEDNIRIKVYFTIGSVMIPVIAGAILYYLLDKYG